MGWLGKKNGRRAGRVERPIARTDELVVEDAGGELLVYDERTAAAHCLSGPAAAVWRACDGQTRTDEIAATLELDSQTVAQAVDQLEQCELLEVPEPVGITRRDATERLAKVAAGAAVAPLIYSVAAPTPALAASQATCLAQGCSNGCGGCHNPGCSCCCTGSANTKYCSADCSSANCNATVQKQVCPDATGCLGTCNGNP